MKRIAFVLLLSGCASGYTIIDRSSLVVSDNARTSARTMVASPELHKDLVEHLALATEVYQKQLDLLKERRNKVRARHRSLNFASFGALAVTGLGAGAAALASSSSAQPHDALLGAGYTALTGVALGVTFQIVGLMQEDASAVDDKIHHLQSLYDSLVSRARTMPETEIGAAVEQFINQALQINVKG